MIDITKKYQTRDGHTVEIISTKGKEPFPVIGYITNDINGYMLRCWTNDGSWKITAELSDKDLMEIATEMYTNVYKCNDGKAFNAGRIFPTAERAQQWANHNDPDFVGTFKLTKI